MIFLGHFLAWLIRETGSRIQVAEGLLPKDEDS